MDIKAVSYLPSQCDAWNAFVARSNEGTLFHRLDFLAYHGGKFSAHEKHVMWNKGESLFGVMPLAVVDEEGKLAARSPYGGSVGGPVFASPPDYAESCGVVSALKDYLKGNDMDSCEMTLPLSCYYARYSETFRLALLENGFRCVNRDISSVVNLSAENVFDKILTSRARNMARKAEKAGVMRKPRAPLKNFWMVMEKTFHKLGKSPTHTFSELQWLCERFPEDVYVDMAYFEGKPVAGIGYFILNKRVNSSFYLCQDPEFQPLQAQSLLVYEALVESQKKGFRWFDFGTSSAQMKGRENLFRFKESFGAVGLFRETYLWENARKA